MPITPALSTRQASALSDWIDTQYIRMLSFDGQVIGTTTVTIGLGTVSSSNGIVYNAVDESLDFVNDGRLYSFHVIITGVASNNCDMNFWIESYNGATWDILTTSGQSLHFENGDTSQTAVTSTLPFPAGLRLRLRAHTTFGTVTLGSSFMEGATQINVPGVTIASISEGPGN